MVLSLQNQSSKALFYHCVSIPEDPFFGGVGKVGVINTTKTHAIPSRRREEIRHVSENFSSLRVEQGRETIQPFS